MYNAVLSALCSLGRVDRARELLSEMPKKGIEPNVRHFTILLVAAMRLRDPNSVFTLWNELNTGGLRPDSYVFEKMIRFCRIMEDFPRGLEVFEDMERNGLVPNDDIIQLILFDFASHLSSEAVLDIANKIRDNNLTIDASCHNQVIVLLCKKLSRERLYRILWLHEGSTHSTDISNLRDDK